ncbi:hypothetical protein QJQ45_028836 [Haematococcus lacustris]|nr:hypothetical protein QJQ45_028836 [Haematococcus lacustris]
MRSMSQSRQPSQRIEELCVYLNPGRTKAKAAGRIQTATQAQPASVTSRPKVPQTIHDVDNGSILGFGADLAEDHPGFHDPQYKRRRAAIADMARRHQIGERIADVEYGPDEVAVWGQVLQELEGLFPRHACAQFLRSYPECGFRKDKVPQLQELSELLQRRTGWTIRPVAGLMHPRDFLAGLAFKHFHSTQYMRHPCQPSYTPEPDVCHELIGHVPMLVDPAYAELVQAIGVASLGADEKMIWHLTKVYWYTVEFGVVREGDSVKAFGAGILSSFGELQHLAAGRAQLLPFDPFAPQPKMSYKDGYQQAYFVLESFEDGAAKIRALAHSLQQQPAALQ